MSKGYTAEKFLNRLSTTWNITLKAPKRQELPGNRKELTGTGLSSGGLSVTTTLTDDRDLSALACATPTNDRQSDTGLRDCTWPSTSDPHAERANRPPRRNVSPCGP